MISVIIPIYNSEKYLDRCIGSVAGQTYSDLEIILCNDGSADGSLSICREWERKDRRIHLISQPNRGVSSARNAGIRNAAGDFVMLLDSDDWLSGDACEKMLALLVEKDADCVVCGLKQTSGYVWAPSDDCFYRSIVEFKQDFTYWLNTELLSTSVNKIYKRSNIRQLYPEDMSFGEDLVFVINYLKNCSRIVFTHEPLYLYEVYNYTSITHSFEVARFDNIEQIQRTILDFANAPEESSIYGKYIKDAVRTIRMWYKERGIDYKHKNATVMKWYRQSYLRKLNTTDYPMLWKDRWMLRCLGMNFLIGVNLIVNARSYVKSCIGKYCMEYYRL